MDEDTKFALWAEMMKLDGDEIEQIVERAQIVHGRTFSEEAMSGLYDTLMIFVGTRIMQRWNQTNEPPSWLRVTVRVEVA